MPKSSVSKSASRLHIQLITIVARSARIEAASLDKDRDNFLDFTQEAFELGNAVQRSIEGCMRDQELLSGAVEAALNKQKDFDKLYRAQLLSASTELISAYSGMRDQQGKSAHLANLAGTSTKMIAEAVGSAIVSLQSGDSTRQRLEHICRGLRLVAATEPSIVPGLADAGDLAQGARLIRQLQAAQLKDAQREFDHDIGQITSSLTAIHGHATGMVGQGRSLYGGRDGDASSFLTTMKETLAQAPTLIARCESAGKSVDDALSVVEDTLTNPTCANSGGGSRQINALAEKSPLHFCRGVALRQ